MFEIARSTLEYTRYEKRAKKKKHIEDTGSNLNV